MEYQATAKYVRSATRKVRLVADSVRRLAPTVALAQLAAMPKSAARPLALVLASALDNAKQKQADLESLKIKIIEVMGGPVMKRWHAVSRGQAHGYKKRMTHIRVVLTDQQKEKVKQGETEAK